MAEPWWRAAAASSPVTPSAPSASDNNSAEGTPREQLLVTRGKLLLERYRRQRATGLAEPPLDSPARFYRWSLQSAVLRNGPLTSASSNHIAQHNHVGSSDDTIGSPLDDGHRHTIADFATPLPVGWEMRASADGAVFFVNRHTHTATWDDPREDGDVTTSSSNDCTTGEPPARAFESLRVKIPSARREAFGSSSYENTVTPGVPPLGSSQADVDVDNDSVQYFDVVFKERGPIGIHFQANAPDGGATVRRLLPGTAAVDTGILRPFDRLVAVNQHPVATASFRHVMLLLQGGLRPLTLSFRRNLRRTGGSTTSDADLDEEVVLDVATDEAAAYRERRRSSRELLIRQPDADASRSNQNDAVSPIPPVSADQEAPAATVAATRDEESVADKIITNIFSLFWTPPEPLVAVGDVQTV